MKETPQKKDLDQEFSSLRSKIVDRMRERYKGVISKIDAPIGLPIVETVDQDLNLYTDGTWKWYTETSHGSLHAKEQIVSANPPVDELLAIYAEIADSRYKIYKRANFRFLNDDPQGLHRKKYLSMRREELLTGFISAMQKTLDALDAPLGFSSQAK